MWIRSDDRLAVDARKAHEVERTMTREITAPGETLVASRAIKCLRWWISSPCRRSSDAIRHWTCVCVSSGVVGVLHQRHAGIRLRARSVLQALVQVHLAKRGSMGRICQDLVVTSVRDTRFRLHSWRRGRTEG